MMLVVAFFIVVATYIYSWSRRTFSYFRTLGIPEDPGWFPFGSKTGWQMLTGKVAFQQLTDRIYKDYPNDKIIGTYGPMGIRNLVIRDMELARLVLIKDFDYFVDRRSLNVSTKANKYFMNMLTTMKGEKWKEMRAIMSPVFTSGKLKSMLPIIHKVGDDFVQYLEKYSSEGIEFDAKDLMTSYTLDVIASAGLGIEANSFKEPGNHFRKQIDVLIGANNADPWGSVRFLLMMIAPWILKMFNISLINKSAVEFIVEVLKSSLNQRRESKEKKNDLIDTIIEAMNDYKNEGKDKSRKSSFSDEEIEIALVSNALLLFFAGFDTSSSGMALVSYFLAKHPIVQEKLYNEIQDAIVANDGDQNLDYYVIQTMPYLDQVVHETLRMYPLIFLERQCSADYKIEELNIFIRKGDIVQIPSPMIMKDPRYFENPHEFNPENFSQEKKADRSAYTYMAFGQGPRNCIGMRFALLIVKTAMVRLLANYKVLECSKTVKELDPDPRSRSFMPKGGIWIKVGKR